MSPLGILKAEGILPWQSLSYLSLFSLAILVSAGCSEKIEPGETKQPPKTLHRLAVATARLTDERLIYEAVATVQAGLTANLSGEICRRS